VTGAGGAALDADVAVDRTTGFRLRARIVAEAGETVAVMGPSGAGKSTLLGALAGFVGLDGGRIRLGGDDVADAEGPRRREVAPARRGIVLLGQDPRLFPHLSALENVAFGLRARGGSRAGARATAASWLARVGLPDAGPRRPAELSGGQQQRVAIARALASRPRLVLLDEPLTSLDPETADDIRALVRAELDCTAVVVTHDAVDALALARRLVVLEAGRVTQDGPVREVFAAPATAFVASLAGLDRVEGVFEGGLWRAGAVRLAGTADPALGEGARAAAVFRPDAVRVRPAAEAGSAGWVARVRRLEPTLAGVRVHTEEPPVAVDVPLATVADLDLAPGAEVALEVPPAAVRILPA
jgi:molybdate transport system ATP-binding protein